LCREEEPLSHTSREDCEAKNPIEVISTIPAPPPPSAPAFPPREDAQHFNELNKNSEEDSFSAAKHKDDQYGCVSNEDADDMHSYEDGPGMIKSSINSSIHSTDRWVSLPRYSLGGRTAVS